MTKKKKNKPFKGFSTTENKANKPNKKKLPSASTNETEMNSLSMPRELYEAIQSEMKETGLEMEELIIKKMSKFLKKKGVPLELPDAYKEKYKKYT